MYKLDDWVDASKLEPYFISKNPRALRYLQENPSRINWMWLSQNKAALHLLNESNINWPFLSCNENAMELLLENKDKINFA
jgi:hypothetical protein